MGGHTCYRTSRQAGAGANGHLEPVCLHLRTRLAKGKVRGPGQFRGCRHAEQLRRCEAGEPPHERRAAEMAAFPRARTAPLQAPECGESRMQKEVRTLNHVYSGTMGPLPPPPAPATPSPALLRQKFARASALNPNPTESLLGRGELSLQSVSFLALPSNRILVLVGLFFFSPFSFLEAVVGAGNRGSLHPNIPVQGKQL